MRTRAAGSVLGLLGCGLLLLATTQPWVATVAEVAPGAPRARGSVGGAELVPWLAPVALATGLAVLASLAGMRWARAVAGVGVLGMLGGAVRAVVLASTGDLPVDAAVVSAASTPWLWVGAGAALVSAAGTVLGWVARSRGTGPGPSAAEASGPRVVDDPHGAEAERRRAAADWRALSEGREPDEP